MTRYKDDGVVYREDFTAWRSSLWRLLDRTELAARIGSRPILIKPNLVEARDPPVTTPVGLVEALIDYLRHLLPGPRIWIGEGTGATGYDTWHPFEVLGYVAMADRKRVRLVDLNQEPLVRLENAACGRWPEMYLPALALDSFLISVPVLKAHTLAGVTLTMKNMMGLAPPAHYQQGGCWKKGAFHHRIHEAIYDLNRYRRPDFTILDATVGMRKAHLWGPRCDPPPNTLAASFDPVAIDAYGAGLLGRDWRDIGHIRLADGVIGSASALAVLDEGG